MTGTAHLDSGPYEDLQRFSEQVAALESALHAQRDMLRQRGWEISEHISDRLLAIRDGLVRAATRLGDETTEAFQLRALAETIALLNSSLDVDRVLTEVIDTVLALTGAERGYIVLRDSQTGELRFRVARDARQNDIEAADFTVSDTIVAEVVETGEPVVAQNALLDARFNMQASIMLHSPRSILCVPLIFRERVTGAIYADNRHIAALFGQRELALLSAFANQAAVAIQNARLFNRVRLALEEITEMKDLMDDVFASIASGVITTSSDLSVLTVNQAAARMLDADREKMVGAPLRSVLPGFFDILAPMIQLVLDQDLPQVVELEPVIPGRGPANLSLRLTPLKDARDVTYGMAVVVDDLTEIKQRDAKLRVVQTYLPPSLVSNIQSIDGLGLSGDEREISVIFADVRGFTTFSEQLPPEELLAIINRYLVLGTDAIQLHDGIVDKYMGDAVIGLFNTQLNPQSDHPERAVRAALSMAYDLRELHRELAPELCLSFGIGIDTGVAMLGNVGSPSRKEFTAIGAPFNTAKQLQEYASAGEILVSENTCARVAGLFEVEPLDLHAHHPSDAGPGVYRLTGLKSRDRR